MPYRICKTIEIENGHQLSRHPDACRFPHGHTRKVEFVLEADSLDANDMVCDFKIIKEAVGELLDQFDHALCMNTADKMFSVLKEAYGERIIGFENCDPTTEVLAEHFFHVARTALEKHAAASASRYPLRPEVRILSVRVWETSSSWAEFSEAPRKAPYPG